MREPGKLAKPEDKWTVRVIADALAPCFHEDGQLLSVEECHERAAQILDSIRERGGDIVPVTSK